MILSYIIVFLFLGLLFYGGVMVGIADCKRRFGIPKGADSKEYINVVEVENDGLDNA